MAQSGYTKLALYSSTTPTQAPVNTNLVQGELAINVVDGKLYYKDGSNVVQLLASNDAANGIFATVTTSIVNSLSSLTLETNSIPALSINNLQNVTFNSSGAVTLPVGTTAQEPTPAVGMIRFNSDTVQFEGYNGTMWDSIGGGANGAGGAIATNKKLASVSYTIDTTENGFSVGPITIADGVTITVDPDSIWVII
jgi:hypothetical protein